MSKTKQTKTENLIMEREVGKIISEIKSLADKIKENLGKIDWRKIDEVENKISAKVGGDIDIWEGGSLVSKKVKCGKRGCKCETGKHLHGPYLYFVFSDGNKRKEVYIGTYDKKFSLTYIKGKRAHRALKYLDQALKLLRKAEVCSL